MKKYTVKMTALLAALALLTACGSTPSAQESTSVPEPSVSAAETAPVVSVSSVEEVSSVASSAEEVAAGIAFDEIDIQDAVTGLNDPYVLQGAGKVNYLFGVAYDGALVVSIQYDDALVDLEMPGEYPLTYLVRINQDALDAYLGGTYDPTRDYGQSVTVTIEVKKTVTVCTSEEAAALVDNGKYVLADGTELLEAQPETPKSIEITGGTVVNAAEADPAALEAAADDPQPEAAPSEQPADEAETTAAPAATTKPTTKPAATATPTATPKPTAKPSTTSTPTATPKPAATPKPSATTPTATPKPATPTPTPKPTPTPTPHTHTWVSVAATGHYEQVQTDTIHHPAVTHEETEWRMVYQCNACGATFYSGSDIDAHALWSEGDCHWASYNQWEEAVNTYTVTDQAAWDEPVYSDVWIEDSPAYEYCSGCGQTR